MHAQTWNTMARGVKSYSIITHIVAGLAAGFILVSCDVHDAKTLTEASSGPADTYRTFLYEIKELDSLSFPQLAVSLRQWQEVRDSVFACAGRDTVRQPHSATLEECRLLHDSLRMEFSRLTLSRQRSYREVLLLKESVSLYADDDELLRSAEEARPFFTSLDRHPAYRGDREQLLSAYRNYLSGMLDKGIHNSADLTAFIEKEDALFRAFLACLHECSEMNMDDITRKTEKCCSEVFLAAQRQDITYKEALISMALRTNRRVIQNVRTCLDDIHQNRVNSSVQARVYIWMILQPYVLLDDFGMALLSPSDRQALDMIADETPGAFDAMYRLIGSKGGRLDELPGMLMEIYVSSM